VLLGSDIFSFTLFLQLTHSVTHKLVSLALSSYSLLSDTSRNLRLASAIFLTVPIGPPGGPGGRRKKKLVGRNLGGD